MASLKSLPSLLSSQISLSTCFTMSGGHHTPDDRPVISVKFLIDTTRDRVIFAESDYEFVDTLLSFLTLPIGTLVRLLSPDSTAIGSLTTMYKSVSSLEPRHLRTAYCKNMLMNPRNASETQCQKLKVNVYPLEPAKLYTCSEWYGGSCSGSDRWFSSIKGRPCRCRGPMTMPVNIEEDKGDGDVYGVDAAADVFAEGFAVDDAGAAASFAFDAAFEAAFAAGAADVDAEAAGAAAAAAVDASFAAATASAFAPAAAVDSDDSGGVYLKDGATRFMITDDLKVIAGSTAACISLFRKLGISHGNEVEERTVEFGAKEVLRLLKFALLSKSPLTEAILYAKGSRTNETVKFQRKKTPQSEKKAGAANYNSMKLKLLSSKSKKTVLYAEAGADVVDFLFSFLTFPLGSAIKLLSKNSGFGCMDNLYKSAEDLSTGSYLKSEECKKMLVCPKLAPFSSFENQILQIEESTYPQYVYDSGTGIWVDADAKAESSSSPESSEERRLFAIVMDPRSPAREVHAGKGYMKGPATFMLANNLYVTPLSPITSMRILNQLNLPINDVVERVVTIGNNEALNLLNASLVSETVLTDVFMRREPSSEVMLKV